MTHLKCPACGENVRDLPDHLRREHGDEELEVTPKHD